MDRSKEISRKRDTKDRRAILQDNDSSEGDVEVSRKKAERTGVDLDKWQKEVLETEGNIILRAGRQVGKSTVIAIKAAEYAANNRNKSIMVISATERQAYLLFSKILNCIYDNFKQWIRKGRDRKTGQLISPTRSTIHLNNGSVIRCLPTGLDGAGIRGYTVDLLIADEAAQIGEGVWAAVIPALATTGGNIILLSTPKGRDNHFYRIWHDEENDYNRFHINAIKNAHKREEPQKSWLLKHQAAKQREMSKREYIQEYHGEFCEDLLQFFQDKDVLACMTGKRRDKIIKPRDYFLGVDIARMGEDESTFEILDRIGDRLTQVDNQITNKTLLTQTAEQVISLDNRYGFRRIYVDDEGIGIGVFDILISNDKTKLRVKALRNSQKIVDYKEGRQTRMLKEDLYFNLLRLIEQRKIILLDDPEIFQSFKSVQYEYTTDKKGKPYMRIFGDYTHIVEGLIRAAWCVKEKNLKIWIDYI